jgi:predicted regulator of Ras-like GTPase activity (Roadblock/LC7/MglB family)
MSTERVLKDVNGVAGVSGCFLCNGEGNVVLSAMPGEYSSASLAAVGRVLSQTMAAMFLARKRKVRDFELIYHQARLVVRNTGKVCLCILGSPDLNIPFLNLTVDLAVRDLKQAAKEEPHAASAEPAQPAGEAPAAAEVEPSTTTETAAAAETAPRSPIQTLTELLELLLKGLDGQGVERQSLMKILRHRSRRLTDEFPFLEGLIAADDRLEVSAVPLEPGNAAEGLAALIHGLCYSLRGMMGEEKAEAAFLSVYDAYYAEHRADFITLGLGDRLRRAVQQPLPSAHSGVDIHLD